MARKTRPEVAGTRVPARVESRPVEGARQLVTIGPEHVAWRGWEGKLPMSADGAIVRVQPPESATDEEVARVVENLRSTGAVAVKVQQRRRSATVVEPREQRPHARARDVVTELVTAANVEEDQRPALLAFVEQVMAGAGL